MEPDTDDEAIRCLIDLANAPFDLASFRRVWERFEPWDPSSWDPYGFNLFISQGYPMWVDPLGLRILSARLPIFYLDDLYGDGEPSAGGDRTIFDTEWVSLVERVQSLIDPPVLEWRDEDEVAYRAAIWSGTHGLLIAQQGAIDSQFGDEVCLKVEGIRLEDFKPTGNLARWLFDRSQRLHDVHGFPPLPTGTT
jgi:hypothetical protein